MLASDPRRAVKRGLLKYRADTLSIAAVLYALALALLPFFVAMPLWLTVLVWLAALHARTFAPFCQHNHAHLPVFNARPLNVVYDFVLAQLTGYPTALWELHHNRGHHRHFLDPERDVAAVRVPGSTRVMSRFWYALRGNFTIHRDSMRIARAERAAGRKTLLSKLAWEIGGQTVVAALLLAWQPLLALAFFILPNLMVSFLVWWESYTHHLDLPGTDAYDASITAESASYNRFTFNIGHHTAHHEKPTLHWSLLPQRTAAIRARIHASCFKVEQRTVGNRMAAWLASGLSSRSAREPAE